MSELNIFEIEQFKEYCIRKIVGTWLKYNKLIICVDFDETIFPWDKCQEKICNLVVNTIKEAKNIGAYLILYTCRNGERLTEAVDYCNNLGIKFDEVNPTTPFKENFSSKPYCNILLDDKSGLIESIEMLQKSIELYREYTTYKIIKHD